MRILHLRFQNLNSLVGAWSIDFTQPAFGADGIFAITGPTGAGKSTLLDAICLALYGCTPRLGKITKSSNEIMSRHTGECYAEVTFETQDGLFRSHWSQRRAKRRADGELQNPKHEIVAVSTGKPIATALREVAGQIETITGLDFERFTRSILLAQGSFAVFLNADPDKRAPILEQITGTGIYSQISVKVHERRTAERKKLEALQVELKGLRALNLAEEQQCHLELRQKTYAVQQREQQLGQHEQAMVWLENLAALEQALAQLQAQQESLTQRMAAFQPAQIRLEQARKALELASAYTRLDTLRTQQRTDRQAYAALSLRIPQQENTTQQAKAALAAAESALQACKYEYQALRPVLAQVRGLDTRNNDRATEIQRVRQLIKTQQTKRGELQHQQITVQNAWDGAMKAATEIREWLTAHPADQALLAHFAGIQQQFALLRDLNQQCTAKRDEQAAAATRQQQAWATCEAAASAAQAEQLAQTQRILAEQEAAQQQRLQHQELTLWQQVLTDLQERARMLEKLAYAVRTVTQARQQQTALQAEQEQRQAKQLDLNHQSELQQARHAALEAQVQQLTERQLLLTTIQSLEAHRQQLKDGAACPLCGALEHPYAAGNMPRQEATAQALALAQTEWQASARQLTQLRTQHVVLQKDTENNTRQQQEATLKIATEMPAIQQALATLGVEGTETDWVIRVTTLQRDHAVRLAEAETLVQTATRSAKAIGELQTTLRQQQETVHQQEREAQQAAHAHERAAANFQRMQQESAELEARLSAAQAASADALAPYGITALTVATLAQIERTLASRRQRWLEQDTQLILLDKKLAELHQQQQYLSTQLDEQQAEISRQQAALQALEAAQTQAAATRHALLGDRQPDAEESRLLQAVEAAEAQREIQRQHCIAADHELDKLQTENHRVTTAITDQEPLLQAQETAFLALRLKTGFGAEADYLAACLPETERQPLAQQAQQLATTQTELAAKLQDKTLQLAQERGRRLTPQTQDWLAQACATLRTELSGLRQQLGGIQHQLNTNERLKQEQETQLQQIQVQQQECSRWDNLHELIGSADGKKYRNFAQGLTFAVMLTHANQQLRKMSDRYLLTRHLQQPLELYVIDNYQAGEIRSTRNLSGGESFIVSLALALGLAHMASQNVRVDSLFLDEGFGTLDEAALDTALETLASLQQNGKLIGVISHVQAMKERISTQIQVSPQTGGRSTLKGPGCHAL